MSIPSESNIRKEQRENINNTKGLKEDLEKKWGVTARVVPVVIGALGAVTHKLREKLQQIPGTASVERFSLCPEETERE